MSMFECVAVGVCVCVGGGDLIVRDSRNGDNKLDIDEFFALHRKYPLILHPAFALQVNRAHGGMHSRMRARLDLWIPECGAAPQDALQAHTLGKRACTTPHRLEVALQLMLAECAFHERVLTRTNARRQHDVAGDARTLVAQGRLGAPGGGGPRHGAIHTLSVRVSHI